MRLGPLISLVRKDLRLFFHDRRALLLTFAAPILVSSFIGWIFTGADASDNYGVSVDLVDLDRSPFSIALIKDLTADDNLHAAPASESQARADVLTGKKAAAIILPAGFANDMASAVVGGIKPVIELAHDPSQGMALAMVHGTLVQHVLHTAVDQLTNGPSLQPRLHNWLNQLHSTSSSAKSGAMARNNQGMMNLLHAADIWLSLQPQQQNIGPITPPFSVREEAMTRTMDKPYNEYAHSFAGMGLQFVMLGAVDFGASILTERQRGLWRRMRAAPIRREVLLAGKVISTTIFAATSLLVAFGFAMIAFGVRIEGSIPGFLLCIGSAALMSASLGILAAAAGRTPQAARGFSNLAVLMLAMLGGAWFPAFLFPLWLQRATLALPTRWAIDGLDAMTWRGLPFSSSIPAAAVMLGYAAAMITTAVLFFRWDVD